MHTFSNTSHSHSLFQNFIYFINNCLEFYEDIVTYFMGNWLKMFGSLIVNLLLIKVWNTKAKQSPLENSNLMVIWRRGSSGHWMLWEDLKIRLQALTMGTPSYSEFSNPIYIYTYLKNTPTSKKLVICLQSAVFEYSKFKDTVRLLCCRTPSPFSCAAQHITL